MAVAKILFGLMLATSLYSVHASSEQGEFAIAINQPVYVQGDTVFFKIFNGSKSSSDRIMEVQLRGYSGGLAQRVRVKIERSIDYNQIVLYETLDAGMYSLVAYDAAINSPTKEQVASCNLEIIGTEQFLNGGNLSMKSLPPTNLTLTTSQDTFQTRSLVTVELNLDDKLNDGRGIAKVINTGAFGNISLHSYSSLIQSDVSFGQFSTNGTSTLKVQGKAFYDENMKVVPEGGTLLILLQEQKEYYQVPVSSEGRFIVNMLPFTGEDELFVLAEDRSGNRLSNLTINWEEFLEDELSFLRLTPSGNKFESKYSEFSKRKELVNNSYEAFLEIDKIDTSKFINEDFEKGLFAPDDIYSMSDYTLFNTMEEYIKEVVRPLRYGQKGDEKIVRVKSLEPDFATGNPVYFIDGYATTNTDYFLSLIPKELKTIKVIKSRNKLKKLGLLGRNGLVVVESKNGDAWLPLASDFKVVGLSKPVVFDEDKVLEIRETAPSFKSTVYWNPTLMISQGKAEFQFKTSDDVGNYTIVVEGIDENGNLFYSFKNIIVRNHVPN